MALTKYYDFELFNMINSHYNGNISVTTRNIMEIFQYVIPLDKLL